MCAMEKGPYDEPSEVTAEEGEVLVNGPDGVAVSLTPEAADETSQRLLYAAAEAKGQQVGRRARSGPGVGARGTE